MSYRLLLTGPMATAAVLQIILVALLQESYHCYAMVYDILLCFAVVK